MPQNAAAFNGRRHPLIREQTGGPAPLGPERRRERSPYRHTGTSARQAKKLATAVGNRERVLALSVRWSTGAAKATKTGKHPRQLGSSLLRRGYVPWLGSLFELMWRSDVFVVYDDVLFDSGLRYFVTQISRYFQIIYCMRRLAEVLHGTTSGSPNSRRRSGSPAAGHSAADVSIDSG